MASLGVGFTLPTARTTSSSLLSLKTGSRGRTVVAVGATRGTSSSAAAKAKEEKGFFEWLWGALQKDEQLVETDPILQKVENKSTRAKPSVSAPAAPKTNGGFGGFGGLFAKK